MLFAEGYAHGKGYQKAKEKPDERKFKADLPQQIESDVGIIPYAQVQNAIDENTDEKFRRCHKGGADQASKKKRRAFHFSIDEADDCEAYAACQDHGNMGISPPEDLEHTVSDAARQHTDDVIFPFTPGAMLSEDDFR